MGQRASSTAVEPNVATLQTQLDAICSLLRDVSGEPFRLVTDPAAANGEATPLAPGWSLTGGGDAQRREAAAELLGHILGAEREIESLCTELLDRYEEVTLVQKLGLQLAKAIDEDALAEVVLRQVAEWLPVRSGEVWLRDGDSSRLAAAIPTGRDRAEAGPLGELGPLEAMDECTPWLQTAGVEAEAVLAVPIPGAGGAGVGVIVLRGSGEGRSFGQREAQVLTAVAGLASGILRSHRLARESWLDEREGNDGDLAHLLHPRRELNCPGLEVVSVYRPGQQPGADHHDLVRTPDGGLAVNLARVSAGGARAAMQMALAKGVLQAEARGGSSPGGMLRRLNDVLSPELIRADLFATAFVARFHPGGRRVDVASAGHASPLLIREASRVEEIEIAGPALGVLEAMSYSEGTRELDRGDVLVLYSDGFAEARDARDGGLGVGYLGELAAPCHGATATEIRDRLLAGLDDHRGRRPLEHDATLVVARVV